MKRPISSQGEPLDKEKIYQSLFEFIDDVLFQFKSSMGKKGENFITQDIEISLNEATRISNTFFAFQNQYQEGRYTTDIGVYIRYSREYFCLIEAKWLPTPTCKDRDEREYVIVSLEKKENGKRKFDGGGGIERFKEGKHAKDLPYSIMIGYIHDRNNADYWLSKINTWITELADTDDGFWTIEDCLNKYVSNKCDRFLSLHKRKDESKILLHHYWIKIATL